MNLEFKHFEIIEDFSKPWCRIAEFFESQGFGKVSIEQGFKSDSWYIEKHFQEDRKIRLYSSITQHANKGQEILARIFVKSECRVGKISKS